MRNWKAFVLASLVSLVLVSAVFAVISPPVARLPEWTSINVVCIYNDFPVPAKITVTEVSSGSEIVGWATDGFYSFRVAKNKSYRINAGKVPRDIAVAGGWGGGIEERLMTNASWSTTNLTSALVIGLTLRAGRPIGGLGK